MKTNSPNKETAGGRFIFTRDLVLFLSICLLLNPAFAITYHHDSALPLHAPTYDDHFVYQYDANGNLKRTTNQTSQLETEHFYTTFNKLEKVEKLGQPVVRFAYDPNGARIARLHGDGSIAERYFGGIESKGGNKIHYYFVGAKRIAKRINSDAPFFFHQDHLGSTSVMTGSAGTNLHAKRYFEFGAIRSISGEGAEDDYAYNDKRHDKDTNTYYYEARSYAPKAMRFMQADTIIPDPTDPQSFNRYAYVKNNPLRYIDPTGHSYRPTNYAERHEKWLIDHGVYAEGGFVGNAVASLSVNFMEGVDSAAALPYTFNDGIRGDGWALLEAGATIGAAVGAAATASKLVGMAKTALDSIVRKFTLREGQVAGEEVVNRGVAPSVDRFKLIPIDKGSPARDRILGEIQKLTAQGVSPKDAYSRVMWRMHKESGMEVGHMKRNADNNFIVIGTEYATAGNMSHAHPKMIGPYDVPAFLQQMPSSFDTAAGARMDMVTGELIPGEAPRVIRIITQDGMFTHMNNRLNRDLMVPARDMIIRAEMPSESYEALAGM